MRKLIQGTALLAVIVLVVACEEAMAPPPSIKGEWTVTEYLIELNDEWGDLRAAANDITMIFTEDRFVWTFDPPLETIGRTITGSYEVLSDSRILLEPTTEHAKGAGGVVQYSFPDASTLILKNINEYPYSVTATRMR